MSWAVFSCLFHVVLASSVKHNHASVTHGDDFINITTRPGVCQEKVSIDYWSIPPYIYKVPCKKLAEREGTIAPGTKCQDGFGSARGLFKTVVEQMVVDCCLTPEDAKDLCRKPEMGRDPETGLMTYANDFIDDCPIKFDYEGKPASDSEILKARIDTNRSGNPGIVMPIYGKRTHVSFRSMPYYPVTESPGMLFISVPVDTSKSANAVMNAVIGAWPVLVLTLIMAILSGIIMWALDSYWNPEEFPPSFFIGSWEGFWWAFVSMTTVGYGDRAPRHFLARTFAFFWVLIGLVIISIFTATVTTSLTAISLDSSIELYGNDIWALENTEEQRFGVSNNAKVHTAKTIKEFTEKLTGTADNAIGGVIDSYVAGFYRDIIKPSKAKKKSANTKDNGLRLGTVFDHAFTYGFVLTGTFRDMQFSKCMRSRLSSKEGKIIEMIQNHFKAYPENDQSAAEEKSKGLFDPGSTIFQMACFACLGMIAFFSGIGILWVQYYWKPKERRQEVQQKKAFERTMTPHTTFEELVTSQSQEVEDAIITEVTAFYKAFNAKLDDIRTRQLRAMGETPDVDKKVDDDEPFNE